VDVAVGRVAVLDRFNHDRGFLVVLPFVTTMGGSRIQTANYPASKPAAQPWLVGVYAGRDGVTGEELDMALGRVWHRRLLDEMFYDRVLGDSL
jgi:hypothetical protein